MGADAAVAEEPTDWLAEGRGPPGSGFDLGIKRGLVAKPHRAAGNPQCKRSVPSRWAQRARSPAPAPVVRKFTTAAPDLAVGAARAAARSAGSLDALKASLDSFEGCGLKATAKTLCFYRGQRRHRDDHRRGARAG